MIDTGLFLFRKNNKMKKRYPENIKITGATQVYYDSKLVGYRITVNNIILPIRKKRTRSIKKGEYYAVASRKEAIEKAIKEYNKYIKKNKMP